MTRGTFVGGLVLGGFIVLTGLFVHQVGRIGGSADAGGVIAAPAPASPEVRGLKDFSRGISSVAKRVIPSVVYIRVDRKLGGMGDAQDFDPENFFRDFPNMPFRFRGPQQAPPRLRKAPEREPTVPAGGSGFVVDDQGHILTNNHVVENAVKIRVKFHDEEDNDGGHKAEVVGRDPKSDLAILKVDTTGYPPVQFAEPDALEVGEWVVAIGSPFEYQHSVTAGIVSALGRKRVRIIDNPYAQENYIQTDAAINPGNSGGPLINLDGKVVGVNSAIATRSGGYMGIGFAIPVGMVKDVMSALITRGKVTRGLLGVNIADVNEDFQKKFGLPDRRGAFVHDLVPGGPAEESGIKRGDVIIELNGVKVKNTDELRERVAATAPGTKVDVKVIRDGKETVIPVVVREQPSGDETETAAAEEVESPWGFQVQEISPELAKELGFDKDEKGVVVTSVEPLSPAAKAGLLRGSLIVEIEREPVKTLADFNRVLRKNVSGEALLLFVKQGKATQWVILKKE
ncbi:MAG: Do family serine endopeptidase [Planctomycetota bacterium]